MPATDNSSGDQQTLYRRLDRRTRLRLWSRRRAKTWTSGVAVVIIVIGVTFAATKLPRLEYHTVSGRVECKSGRAVQGVYIHDSASRGSGFARWNAETTRPSVAWYTRNNLLGKKYSVSVGCGGIPQKWEVNVPSEEVSGVVNNFTCIDGPIKIQPGYCYHTS